MKKFTYVFAGAVLVFGIIASIYDGSLCPLATSALIAGANLILIIGRK
jgi:hypothetical protein